MEKIFPSKKKLLIFDLDDTLIRSHIDYFKLRKEILKFLDFNSKEQLIKKPISELLQILEKEDPIKANTALNKIKILESECVDKAEKIPFAEFIPDILDKYGLFYAILTNNTRAVLNSYLQKPTFAFLNKFFSLTRDEVEMKPSPNGIHRIIKFFEKKLVTKENSVYIGDSFIDANASYRAGLDFVHFDSRDVDLSQFDKKPVIKLKNWNNFEKFIETLIY